MTQTCCHKFPMPSRSQSQSHSLPLFSQHKTKCGWKKKTNSLLTQFQHIAIHQDNFTDRSPDYKEFPNGVKKDEFNPFNKIFATTQMGFLLASVGCGVGREGKGNSNSTFILKHSIPGSELKPLRWSRDIKRLYRAWVKSKRSNSEGGTKKRLLSH